MGMRKDDIKLYKTAKTSTEKDDVPLMAERKYR